MARGGSVLFLLSLVLGYLKLQWSLQACSCALPFWLGAWRAGSATCGGSHGRVAAVASSEGERCSKVHSTPSEWTELWSPAATRLCTCDPPPEPEACHPPSQSSLNNSRISAWDAVFCRWFD